MSNLREMFPKTNAEKRGRLPYHLEADSPPIACCSHCERATWGPAVPGSDCGMTQPDGSKCIGVWLPVASYQRR